MEEIQVKRVNGAEEQSLVWGIRKAVFVEEQGVDQSLEYEYEEESTQYIARWHGQAVGTARWRQTGKGIKLERFAVLKDFRGKGIGNALVRAVLRDLPSDKRIYLHAQESAVFLYENNGFVISGDAFEEAGITHFIMEKG